MEDFNPYEKAIEKEQKNWASLEIWLQLHLWMVGFCQGYAAYARVVFVMGDCGWFMGRRIPVKNGKRQVEMQMLDGKWP
jgi:hypothetical protein